MLYKAFYRCRKSYHFSESLNDPMLAGFESVSSLATSPRQMKYRLSIDALIRPMISSMVSFGARCASAPEPNKKSIPSRS